MEQLIALLESAEKHLATTKAELETAQLQAGESVEVLTRCLQLVKQQRDLTNTLDAKELALAKLLGSTLGTIEYGFKVKVPGYTLEMSRTGNLNSWRTEKGARNMITEGWRDFVRFTKDRGIFWDFCRAAVAAIAEYLAVTAADSATPERMRSHAAIMDQVRELKQLLEA